MKVNFFINMYQYGLIGNCQSAALVSQSGSIDWLCFPHPDSDPIFGRLLDPDGGHFSVESAGQSAAEQSYFINTAILCTVVTNADGSQFKITDFCPRFYQYGRIFRPISLFRIVEPLKGSPTIRVSCRPVKGWSKEPIKPVRGNSHMRYDMKSEQLRLYTNMPLTYLSEEIFFVLKEPLYFALTWSSTIEEDLGPMANRFLQQTLSYWDTWVKHCSIPTLYQKETIRSALTLKLHCYEDTGAILAALTTSLPEEIGKSRNWDYRFCWLRDAYFVLSAFNRLGHFEEMEGFIKFLLGLIEKLEQPFGRLRPVYRLDQSCPLPEIEHLKWNGYHTSKPVRSGNQAAEHIQNDVYGEMILTLAPIFFDERFHHLRTKDHERLLIRLGQFCAQSISKPDAGLWELRDGWQEHTFSNLMCWAGLDRIDKVRQNGFLTNLEFDLEKAKSAVIAALQAASKEGSLRNGPADESFDAALLLAVILKYPDENLVRLTTERIHSELRLGADPFRSSFLYRYRRKDDFGEPQSAFLICSFWLVQALVGTGHIEQARKIMENSMRAANSVGLFAEHYLPDRNEQTGNFPQAYSHVGQILAAFAISPEW